MFRNVRIFYKKDYRQVKMDIIIFCVLLALSSSPTNSDDDSEEHEKDPVFITPPNGFIFLDGTIKEDKNVSNMHIYTVEAESSRDMIYKLLENTGENHNDLVDIGEDSGRITFKASAELDYEATMDTQNILMIEFIAEEKREKKTPKYINGTLYMQLEDVNDVIPSFEADRRVAEGFTIADNTEQDTVIGRLRAKDGDATSPNNHISSYGITDINTPFVMSSGGRIRIRHGRTVNATEQDLWNLTITAIDDGQPRLTGSVSLIIRVSDTSGASLLEWCEQSMTSSLALIYVIKLVLK